MILNIGLLLEELAVPIARYLETAWCKFETGIEHILLVSHYLTRMRICCMLKVSATSGSKAYVCVQFCHSHHFIVQWHFL